MIFVIDYIIMKLPNQKHPSLNLWIYSKIKPWSNWQVTKGKVSFKNIVGYIFQEINAKIIGIFGSGVGYLLWTIWQRSKTTAKTQSPRENTCSQTNISTSSQVATKYEDHEIVVFNWPYLSFSTYYSGWGSGKWIPRK